MLYSIDDSILLVFYESVHLNRNFISTLTHAATEFSTSSTSSSSQIPGIVGSSGSPPMSPSGAQVAVVGNTYSLPVSADLNSSFDASNNTPTNGNNNMRLLNPLSLTIPTSSTSSTSTNMVDITDVSAAASASAAAAAAVSALDAVNQTVSPPTNLLVIFLESCSAVLQETKMDSNNIYDSIKLFMLIMVCISEDQYANSLLHDSSILYSVFLYQAVTLKQLANF